MEKSQFVGLYERQFNLWKEMALTPYQLKTIEGLERLLPRLQKINDKVLELAYQIQPYTIDKILGMNSEDLAILALSEKLKSHKQDQLKPPYYE